MERLSVARGCIKAAVETLGRTTAFEKQRCVFYKGLRESDQKNDVNINRTC